MRKTFLQKFGPWFLICGLLLGVVVITICSGVCNDLEDQKRQELRDEILQKQGETK
jgi:hypothetical protein